MDVTKINGSIPNRTEKPSLENKSVNLAPKKGVNGGKKFENEEKLVNFDEFKEQLEETSIFSSYDYIYTANGTETYGDIKEKFGIKDGVIRKNNEELFEGINGNADGERPPEGTKIYFHSKDFGLQEVTMLDDEGNEMKGFSEDMDGNLYYTIQKGDTKTSIYNKLDNDSLKYYNPADILDGYPEYALQIGAEIEIPKKGLLGTFFAWLFG